MAGLPLNKRKFHAFLSHAHADKSFVDGLHKWLSEVSGIPIWYDARHLPAGATIATRLAESVTQCRSMIIVLSSASINSGWVREEYEAAIGQRTQLRDFRVMFRDQQVFFYSDDVALLGILHRIAYPYRRRVLNWEL